MHVLIPLIVLTLYFVSFSWFLSWLLPGYPANVNAGFVSTAWKYSLAAAGLCLIFFVLFKLYRIFRRHFFTQESKEESTPQNKKGNRPAFKNSIEKFDFLLILLPLTPVVQYILNNRDILSPLGSLLVLAVFAAFSALFIIVIPTLLRVAGSTKTLMILGLAFTFTITNMALLSAEFSWFELGNLKIQLGLFCAIFLAGWILYNLVNRKSLYFLIAIFFIANSVIQVVPHNAANTTLSTGNNGANMALNTSNELVDLVGSKKPLSTPDIYLLVYDAYVTNETNLAYGIDNSAQEGYLESLGFKLYPDTYTIGSPSIDSMSRVLNASTEYYGNARNGVSGDGVVQNLLKSFGYETYGLFPDDYFFQGIGSSYDVSYPKHSGSVPELLLGAIVMGEFRNDLYFGQPSHDQFVQYKLGIFESLPNPDKPTFVYMHTDLPSHAQISGACQPDEIELYSERLTEANAEMKQDLEVITQRDPSAIIIVAGDHGPYLTKNCQYLGGNYDLSQITRLDIQSRFGCFLAIKWPTEDFSKYDNITVLQDVFPAIFAYLFKDDTLLEAKVPPDTIDDWNVIAGASVDNGTIHGGVNDGEPLFVDSG